MNPEVKRRIVMSLVSLALAFGLLATYYIVTVPWNRTAVGQALTAGALLGIAALVAQFMPIRAPVPAASTDQQPEAPPQRSWQPEPEFGAEDFQTDLATMPAPGLEAPSLPTLPARAAVAHAAPAPASAVHAVSPTFFEEPAPATRRVDSVPPDPILPQPLIAPAAIPRQTETMTSERLERVIANVDETAASEVVRMDELKDAAEVLMVRNDHVRVDPSAQREPMLSAAVSIAPKAPVRASSLANAPKTAPIVPSARTTDGPRPLPPRPSPKSEWREPDPETPRELLRELAEYWHVKYETERKRHNEILAQYEDVVRRLERLETRSAEVPVNGTKMVVDEAKPLDEMTVADAVIHESKNDLDDRWDRRTAQIEHFH